MRKLALVAVLGLVPALAAAGDEAAHVSVSPRVFGAAGAARALGTTAPGFASPTAAIRPMTPSLGLNPAVAAAMANPVPATAAGLPAAYFTLRAQPQVTAAPALASTTKLAAAADPKSGQSLQMTTGLVYDNADRGAKAFHEPEARQAVRIGDIRPTSADYLREVRGLSGTPLLRGLHAMLIRSQTDDRLATARRVMSETDAPSGEAKGVFAREKLWAYTRYYDRGVAASPAARSYWASHVDELVSWNKRYPPSAEELEGNDVAAGSHGRNPFVDDSTLADRIGAAAFKR